MVSFQNVNLPKSQLVKIQPEHKMTKVGWLVGFIWQANFLEVGHSVCCTVDYITNLARHKHYSGLYYKSFMIINYDHKLRFSLDLSDL
jgi:hypothetical protein